MKEPELLKILAALSTEYNIEPKRETSYRFTLIDQDYDITSEAVKEWIRNNKWPPRSAELLDLIEDIEYERKTPALPGTTQRRFTDDEYEALLRTEKLAKEMGIRQHPNALIAIEEARAWKARQ